MRPLLALVLVPTLLVGCAAEELAIEDRGKNADLAAPYESTGVECDYQVHADATGYTVDPAVAADVEALVGFDRVHPFRWDLSGARTELLLTAEDARDLRRVWSSEAGCPEYHLVDLTVGLHTEDGLLDEVFDASLRYEGLGSLRLERWVAQDQLVGTWDPTADEAAELVAVDVEIVANLSAETSVGELAVYATLDSGSSIAWDAGRWPVE